VRFGCQESTNILPELQCFWELQLTLCCAEREVRKANRELHHQTSKMSDIQKIEHLTKRCSDLLAEMKRHERESIKNKKRGDQLQKDKDNSRNELNKTVSLKEKLEKLCRELQKENNKLKVCPPPSNSWEGCV
jgi:hypothetical protein